MIKTQRVKKLSSSLVPFFFPTPNTLGIKNYTLLLPLIIKQEASISTSFASSNPRYHPGLVSALIPVFLSNPQSTSKYISNSSSWCHLQSQIPDKYKVCLYWPLCHFSIWDTFEHEKADVNNYTKITDIKKNKWRIIVLST